MKNTFKPILFNTEMVQAILQGRKTQTRRIIKPQPKDGFTPKILSGHFGDIFLESRKSAVQVEIKNWKNHQLRDILWVRETSFFHLFAKEYEYKADEKPYMKLFTGWKPSIHMPKAAARIFLKVTNVRVERLQDITEADAVAEGVELYDTNRYKNYEDLNNSFLHARISFASLWESINGKNSWEQNPYVWIYDFEVIEKPKDFI